MFYPCTSKAALSEQSCLTSVHTGLIVVCAVEALAKLVVGKSWQEIVSDFRGFYRLLTSESQLRWVRRRSRQAIYFYRRKHTEVTNIDCVDQLGPEKGVIHLASAAVLNAVWDLWARAEGKVAPMLLHIRPTTS